MAERYDVVIVGGGPGGYVAGIRAAQLGLKTAVVEKAEVGGVCLNWGCIPTKALIRNAEVLNLLQRAKGFGLSVDGLNYDYGQAFKRSRRVVKRLVKGVESLLKKNKVDLIPGAGVLTAKDTVVVGGEPEQELKTDKVVIATGSRPKALPGMEFDGQRVLSSNHVLAMKEVLSSLMIIGAGAIGVEFAYIYQSYGCQVTLLEMMPQVLPLEDVEVADLLERSLKRQGIDVRTSTRVEQLSVEGNKVRVQLSSGEGTQELEADKVLVAVGRDPNSEGLGLEELGVAIEGGFIQTDEFMRTSVPGIYAIGDVTGPPLLAHKAMREGIVAVEHIAGLDVRGVDYNSIPSCTYCQPQVASIGLTEAAAKERGYQVKVGKFPFRAIGKAIAVDEYQGMVKLVVDAEFGEILGAHIIGAEATELIHELALAKTAELTPIEIEQTIHAHPTLSEALVEAALAVEGAAIHI